MVNLQNPNAPPCSPVRFSALEQNPYAPPRESLEPPRQPLPDPDSLVQRAVLYRRAVIRTFGVVRVIGSLSFFACAAYAYSALTPLACGFFLAAGAYNVGLGGGLSQGRQWARRAVSLDGGVTMLLALLLGSLGSASDNADLKLATAIICLFVVVWNFAHLRILLAETSRMACRVEVPPQAADLPGDPGKLPAVGYVSAAAFSLLGVVLSLVLLGAWVLLLTDFRYI